MTDFMKTKERKAITIGDTYYQLIQAEYGLRNVGNQVPYFSVTGSAWLKGSRLDDRNGHPNPDRCGAMHSLIAEAFPSLHDLIALHLSDIDGVPMHAHSNGWYWFSDYDGKGVDPLIGSVMSNMTPAQRAEHYLRTPVGHFDGVTTRAEFDARVDSLAGQWRHEARAAIVAHGLIATEGASS